MHEQVLKTLTVGVVGGLIVYWLTSRREHAMMTENPHSYKPIFGDVRAISHGSPTCACCQCCGLPTPQNVTTPLAADYLCCAPEYAAPVSKWNVGVSIQVSCDKLDANVYRNETATTFPHGMRGPRTTPSAIRIPQCISCSPDVALQIDCTEIV